MATILLLILNKEVPSRMVGNIQTLNCQGYNRSGFGAIDQLTYAYQGNQLHTLAEGSSINHGVKATMSAYTNYEYDDNGNMTTDSYKNITIQYNIQNLPTRVDFLGTNKYITILYDAAGVKLTKEVHHDADNDPSTTSLVYKKHYVGGIEYTDDGTTVTLEAIYHEKGRLVNDGGRLEYEYTLKDHLGNARVSFKDKGGDGVLDETDIIQENHYYPFGLGFEGLQTPQATVENKYQYNGKEMNDDLGLDWIDYGARWYDPSLGRWSAVNPLAEAYIGHSPYAYVMNNPMMLIDPNGMNSSLPSYMQKNGDLARFRAEDKARTEEERKASEGDKKRKQKAKYMKKFHSKIGSVLDKMNNNGESEAAIKQKANELAEKYQNKRWLRFFSNLSSSHGDHSFGGHKRNKSRSSATGGKIKDKITINPFPEPIQRTISARDGSSSQAANNTEISLGIIAKEGASITTTFRPMNDPDNLSIIGRGFSTEQNILSTGYVRSTDLEQMQTYTYTTTVSTDENLRLSIQVDNRTETDTRPDRWSVQITVQNPFTVNPLSGIVQNNTSGSYE